ncbi:Valine--pyruvate aminotransferase [Saitoella coloradoensis]
MPDASFPEVINLQMGWPTESLLPSTSLAKAASEVLLQSNPFTKLPDLNSGRTPAAHPLQYGSDLGPRSTRKVLAEWTSEKYALNGEKAVKSENIVMTPGASYGLMNVLQLCTSPHNGYTRRAFCTSPTYFLAAGILQDAGFAGRMSAVNEDAEGIDIVALREALEKEEEVRQREGGGDKSTIEAAPRKKKVFRYVVYCVTTYANPSGQIMSERRRKQLIELARKYDALVISDDVYDFLHYTPLPGGKIPARLVTHDVTTRPSEYGNTISNCSFAKLLAPGFRVGWIETASPLLALQLAEGGANHSGGCPSQLNSSIVGHFIQSGALDENIVKLRHTYGQRSETYRSALSESLPSGTTIQGGEGGYFLWVGLPDGYDAREIVKRAKEEFGVQVASGDAFEVPGDERGWGGKYLRLSLSWCENEEGREGIRRLGEACKAVKEGWAVQGKVNGVGGAWQDGTE